MSLRLIILRVMVFSLGLWGGLGMGGQPLHFEKLGTSYDKFPEDRITAMLKDRHGFMWFGTQRGLIRYDGTDVRWYRHDPDDVQSLASDNVRVLYEDRGGGFWVGTSAGLNRLDRNTGVFTRFPQDEETPQSLASGNIWALFEDGEGVLWIGTDAGLHALDQGIIRRYSRESGDLNGNWILALEKDGSGGLWIGTDDGGLSRREAKTERFIHIEGIQGPVTALHLDRGGGLWIGTRRNGLLRMEGGDTERFPNLESGAISDMTSDHLGTVWIGTATGLNQFDPEEDRFIQHVHVEGDSGSLRHDRVHRVYGDDGGQLWIATGEGGVDRLDRERQRFQFDALNGSEAWAVLVDRKDITWVGTKYGGLARLEAGSTKWFLPEETIRSLYEDAGGRLWVGANKGLFRSDAARGLFEKVVAVPSLRIWHILQDQGGALWLGTGQGLARLDLDREALTWFKSQPGSKRHLSGNIVTALVEDREGRLWIGSYGGGLNEFDPSRKSFRHYRKQTGKGEGLSADDVTHLCLARNGLLWIATHSGGLNRFDPRTGRFKRYTLKQDFPDNAVMGVAESPDGALWLSTGEGLVKFHPGSERHVIFKESDGFLIGGAVPGSCFSHDRGAMLFGGTHGLVRFHPDDLRDPPPPPLVFTSFKKGGREIQHFLLPGSTLSLTQEEKTFSVEFAILDYRSPHTHRYGYQRVGIDDDWEYTTSKGHVSYTKYLSYGGGGGQYELRVKGTNGNGVWNEASLAIVIEPPAWKQWLPLYALAAVGLLVWLTYAFLSLRERRRRRLLEAQTRLAEQRAHIAEREKEVEREARRIQEEHTAILQEHLEQISTEIANDLHDGPLGALHGLGFSLNRLKETLGDETHRKQVTELTESMLPHIRQTLRNVCGELLLPDFRQGLIPELLAYAEVIEGQDPNLKIEHRMAPFEEELPDEVRACVYRIYRTILKNVGKHAGARHAAVSLHGEAGHLTLQIADDGRGFQVPANWEDFKRNRHYGLYMASYFAKSVGGELKVASKPGRGATVTLRIPVSAKLMKETA